MDSQEDFILLLAAVRLNQERQKWKYIEPRPLGSWVSEGKQPSMVTGEEFFFHALDLQPSLETIYHKFHKSCVQRKLHRAERENLDYEGGPSESLLAKFYHLLLLTRRRRQLPPQSLAWFRTLTNCIGDRLTIRLVSQNGQPIASILTMSFKDALVYSTVAGTPGTTISAACRFSFGRQFKKASGAHEFDLGRADADNPGLVAFKDHLGATCSKLQYFRAPLHDSGKSGSARHTDWKLPLAGGIFEWMPDPVLKLAGNLLYRHVG